jgi:hypothetical protein
MTVREIKFRVRHRIDEWTYINFSDGFPVHIYATYMECLQKKEKFCQFTGLLDRQGREIYEGDLLRATEETDSENWRVIFADGGFVAQNDRADIGLHYWVPSQMEVIGGPGDDTGDAGECPNLTDCADQGRMSCDGCRRGTQ